MRNYSIVVLIILLLAFPSSLYCGGKKITVTANPDVTNIMRGMTIQVPVNIDVAEFDFELGSFTATLKWDPGSLEFKSLEGGSSKGFYNPVVNNKRIADGELIFASAFPEGAKGTINVLNVKFEVLGKSGTNSTIELGFSTMAAAKTFENLLPYLENQEKSNFLVNIGSNPTNYSLENYPNPFNPSTTIEYSLPAAGSIKLIVYNVLGQQVRVLLNEEQEAGRYSIEWNSKNDHHQVLPSGVYILRMQTNGFVKDKKLLLLK